MTRFDVSIKVLSTALVERIDLNDLGAGYAVLSSLILPDDEQRQGRLKSARVHGSFPVGPVLDDDGTVIAPVRIKGGTWAQVATRQEAMRTAVRLDSERFVEVTVEGVMRRWFSDGPVSIRFAEVSSSDLVRCALDYELRFLVQPNPTVVIA